MKDDTKAWIILGGGFALALIDRFVISGIGGDFSDISIGEIKVRGTFTISAIMIILSLLKLFNFVAFRQSGTN